MVCVHYHTGSACINYRQKTFQLQTMCANPPLYPPPSLSLSHPLFLPPFSPFLLPPSSHYPNFPPSKNLTSFFMLATALLYRSHSCFILSKLQHKTENIHTHTHYFNETLHRRTVPMYTYIHTCTHTLYI